MSAQVEAGFLSTAAKEAIKTAMAITIAMGIALYMDWEKPYWAGFAVAMISLGTVGQSLNKGAMRMFGTLVAIAVVFALLAAFSQERWWFMGAVSLYIGFCAYMMTGPRRQYFWYVSGFVCVVIAVDSSNSLTAFQIAVERTQETATGVLVYSLVAALLWPQSNREALEAAARRLFAVQGRLYRTYRGLARGEGKPEDSRPQRVEALKLLKQVEQLLNAAETDSYEVWEVRNSWRRFLQQSWALMEALGHWRTGLPEVEPLDLAKLLPELDALHRELDQRFAQIERMLDGQPPDRMPQAVTLAVDKAKMRDLSRFQEAAVLVAKSHLDGLEALSRSLFDCARHLGDHGGPAPGLLPETAPRRALVIDPDRLQGVVSVLATLWISFFLWVYVNPPGHASFVMMSTILSMVIVMGGTGPISVALSVILGTLFAGVLYLFVMPHLSGYAELGLMIFVVTFAICYLFSEPRQAGTKASVLAMFVNNISVQNEQTYSFASYANGLTMVVLVSGLLVATAYIPTSPRPEKVFLRLFRRFCRHSAFLMSELGVDGKRKRSLARRLKAALYRNDLLALPVKLAGLAQRIDYHSLPGTSPEQVQALVSSLFVVAFRIRELVEAYEFRQADVVEKHLLDEFRAWRQFLEGRFKRRADDPTLMSGPAEEGRDRLATQLARLEARVNETLAQAGESELSTEDLDNFYRLLGSYRGLSEAMVGYAPLANGINWARWQEARF